MAENLFTKGFYLKAKDGTEIDIPINAKITVLTGDSATGKTKMIRYLSKLLRMHDVLECTIETDKILVIENLTAFQLLMNGSGYEECIIFIDNFDLTDFSVSIPFLEESRNYFVICAKRKLPKCSCQLNSCLEMHHSEQRYAPRPIYDM